MSRTHWFLVAIACLAGMTPLMASPGSAGAAAEPNANKPYVEYIDDTFLASEGVTDFEQYRVDPAAPLAPTFFVPDEPPPPSGVHITGDRWE